MLGMFKLVTLYSGYLGPCNCFLLTHNLWRVYPEPISVDIMLITNYRHLCMVKGSVAARHVAGLLSILGLVGSWLMFLLFSPQMYSSACIRV